MGHEYCPQRLCDWAHTDKQLAPQESPISVIGKYKNVVNCEAHILINCSHACTSLLCKTAAEKRKCATIDNRKWKLASPSRPICSLSRRFYRAMLSIRGTSHGPVSVCPSQVGVLLKRMNESSWFWHVSFLPPVLHCVKRKLGYLQK